MAYLQKLGPTDALPNDGIHVAHIAKGSGLTIDLVRIEVETLIADGHLYSTSDEDQ